MNNIQKLYTIYTLVQNINPKICKSPTNQLNNIV